MKVFAVTLYIFKVILRNIFFNLKKKFSSFKVIKLKKLFLEFLPVLYLNEKNSYLNQIKSIKSIIKGYKRNLLKSNNLYSQKTVPFKQRIIVLN